MVWAACKPALGTCKQESSQWESMLEPESESEACRLALGTCKLSVTVPTLALALVLASATCMQALGEYCRLEGSVWVACRPAFVDCSQEVSGWVPCTPASRACTPEALV